MTQLVAIVLVLAIAGAAFAAWLMTTRNLSFHQALLYAPLKLLNRVNDRSIAQAQQAPAPVVYVIAHQSRFDPALMLSLLPADTLHILDAESARSALLEPWRAAARTIAFNAEHLFISRRLVRQLKGRGRLAVYLPPLGDDPTSRQISLYRAVARIAGRGGASVAVICVHGYRKASPNVVRADAAHFGLFPKLSIRALPPVKLPGVSDGDGQQPAGSPSAALMQLARQAADISREA